MADPTPSTSTKPPSEPVLSQDPAKDKALKAYKKALKQHEELSENLKKREYFRPITRHAFLSRCTFLLTTDFSLTVPDTYSQIRTQGS